MEPAAVAQAGSLDWGGIGVEFHNQIGEPEEFHRPISVVPQENNDSSFTALLELPANQAMELLVHSTDEGAAAAEIADNPSLITSAASVTPPPPPYLLLPIIPSNAALVDGAEKFTRLANSERKSTANSESMKPEAGGSESDPNSNSYCSVPYCNAQQKLNSSTKRKEREKKEKEEEGSNSKKAAKEEGTEKGDYVHVRVRRGQATDSHSLAERARREKINAKMKLLQEMVPGCNKISGTALVLDEIINHVQSLQRQVEDGSTMDNGFPGMVMMPSDWHEEEQVQKNGVQLYKLFWHSNDFHQLNWPNSSSSREDDHL